MALDLSRVQAICFDLDGTLSDTDDVWVNALERRLRWMSRLFPRGDVRPFARWAVMCAESPGNLVYYILDRLHLDDDVGRLYNFISRKSIGRKPKTYCMVPGVYEMLCHVSQHFPISLVSARDRAGAMAFLAQFGLTGMFQAVATAMTCRYTKPFPDPILWAAEQMGVPPDRCLMVGDTTVDIRAGKAAGAQTVGVLCGFGQEAELRRAGADVILPHTAALKDLLFGEY
ncbi:MAG: HAD family hydrolase [Chloroflexi bacterium]|nr:HAD family hydrolase [Chloroflexota bacterium]